MQTRQVFDYQSVCHCSKTRGSCTPLSRRLTTSQFVTAPKQLGERIADRDRLTTSQFVTAPKLGDRGALQHRGLTTSQFVTAPKLFFILNLNSRV